MIKNYFKVAFRNLIRHKGFSFINILGLTLGLTACLLIAVIASPIACFTMNKWLEDYVYRIEIRWCVFVIAALPATIIALATISIQTNKAALSNPVNSLRNE